MTAVMEDEDYWSDAWRRHVDRYLTAAPRLAHWLAAKFPDRGLSIWQLAAGSCRDSLHLARLGYDAVGTDFDEKTLAYIRSLYPELADRVRREDAFHLSLPDKAVDLTVSNGFWVLFDEDEKVLDLLREQVRVSRRYAVFVTQNGENPKLKREFARLVQADDLYDIRFYTRHDIARLVEQSGVAYRRMRLLPFGGAPDLFYYDRVKGVPNPFRRLAPRIAPRLYDLMPWYKAERVACILEL